MALKKRISYQWQLFIPLIAMLWLLIFGMALWQRANERDFRQALFREQLALINSRIIEYYDSETNPQDFFKFLGKYYIANPLYDQIRISVYENDRLIYSIGSIIKLSESDINKGQGLTNDIYSGPDEDDESFEEKRDKKLEKENFFYRYDKSKNGKLQVFTVLPYDEDIVKASLPNTSLWIIVFAIAVILTLSSYFATRYFGQNIKILRMIADKAATDPDFVPTMDFPHDELGDISRRIVYLYNERAKVVQQLRQEHNIALHAMEEKARLKRQLTNNINHELKTPIGVIKGYLDTIVANPDMDEESKAHFIRKALEHANRLTSLINDISAITRLEDGGSMINTEELDFHDLVFTVKNDLEESDVLGGMKFVYNIPTDTLVMGNNNLLTGMIINLAKNAAAYSKGTECGVNLIGEDEKFYKFSFYDNGVGVSEEHIPHLFERFYRVDSGRSRKTGGTGLGLPIVQNTVLAHGGTIEIRNREEGGLEFIFTLIKAVNV